MSDKPLKDNLRDASAAVKMLWVLMIVFVAIISTKLFGIGGILVSAVLIRYTYKALTEPAYRPSGTGSPSKH